MIGVFDSGFGGLTVLKGFLRGLPRYDYLYLGDNARAPYGDKSQRAVYNYTRQAVEFLFGRGCRLVILACNTSSAEALRKLQRSWLPRHFPDRRVLGVIVPVAEEAARLSRAGRLGVIGTRATIGSGTYRREVKKISPALMLYQQSCPLLVPLVEAGRAAQPETKTILKKYLDPLKARRVDALILGCTHYPFLLTPIRRIMGKAVKVLDSPTIVAEKFADYLKRHPEIEKRLSKNGRLVFYTTGDREKFRRLGSKFLKKPIKQVKKIRLSD